MDVAILSQPNDLVESSEQNASKMSDLVTSICEMKLLGGRRFSMSKGVDGNVDVELKYLLKDSAFSRG